jgi:hypothetical protein
MAPPATTGRPDRRTRPPFDPTSIDLTDFDVERLVRRAAGSTEEIGARLVDLTRDATYVAVGLGVLGFQRLQVRRRELERRLR